MSYQRFQKSVNKFKKKFDDQIGQNYGHYDQYAGQKIALNYVKEIFSQIITFQLKISLEKEKINKYRFYSIMKPKASGIRAASAKRGSG